MPDIDPLGLDSDMLAGAKAYLRLDNDDDDAGIGDLLLAAIAHAERFTGQLLIRRNARVLLPATSAWQTLPVMPVSQVTSATGIPAEGATFALSASAWEAKISSYGEAYIRIAQPGIAGRIEVACVAGISASWDLFPESMRLGVLRLLSHFYGHRDMPDDPGPPLAALALLRPWRKVRL